MGLFSAIALVRDMLHLFLHRAAEASDVPIVPVNIRDILAEAFGESETKKKKGESREREG